MSSTDNSADRRHDWELPGSEEVAPGVFRIPLPLPNDGLRAVNVYAIVDGARLTLIDAGWAIDEARTQLDDSLNSLGYDLSSIDRFLITHMHRDHFTQALALRKTFGMKVALGADERETVQLMMHRKDRLPRAAVARLKKAGAEKLAEQVMLAAGIPDPHPIDWEEPDEWLTDYSRVSVGERQLDVIPTPGHTQGHVVFHDVAQRLLFAGDHVLPHITPSIGIEPVPTRSPLAAYLASLETIRLLADSTLLPAHGPVSLSTTSRVEELVKHHDVRLEATLNAVTNGADTGFQVARALPWTSRGRHFDDLDTYNQSLAVSETVAHLTVLVDRNLINRTELNDVLFYALVDSTGASADV